MMQLPGKLGQQAGQEFVLERSFVPAANPNVLTAFIMARSDGTNYGQLVLYDTPDNEDIPSPSKAATNIDSNTDISKQLSLLDQRGSQIVRGDVQLIPIGDSILYVRPIYVQTTEGAAFPRFKYVAVAYGENAVLTGSMPDAFNALFGQGHLADRRQQRRWRACPAARDGNRRPAAGAGAGGVRRPPTPR